MVSTSALRQWLFVHKWTSLISTVFLLLLWDSWRHYRGIHTHGGPLVFEIRRRSRAELERFLGELENRRIAHVRSHVLAGGGSDADELRKLVWLKNEGAITDEEFERLKQRILTGLPALPPELAN